MQYATISMLFSDKTSTVLEDVKAAARGECQLTGETQVIYCKDPAAHAWQIYCKINPPGNDSQVKGGDAA